jgi:hypothetical protein
MSQVAALFAGIVNSKLALNGEHLNNLARPQLCAAFD